MKNLAFADANHEAVTPSQRQGSLARAAHGGRVHGVWLLPACGFPAGEFLADDQGRQVAGVEEAGADSGVIEGPVALRFDANGSWR